LAQATTDNKDCYQIDKFGSLNLLKETSSKIGVKCTISKTNNFKKVELTYYYAGITMASNTWAVADGSSHEVGENIEQDGIKLTLGGFTKGTTTEDSWKNAVTDDAGNNSGNVPEYLIDGFQYATSGANNGMGENKSYYTGNRYTVPCHGAYAMFEPTKKGKLSVYILQNGSINVFDKKGDQTTGLKSEYSKWSGDVHDFTGELAWRPIYIVDENGTAIDAVGTSKNKLKWNWQNMQDLLEAQNSSDAKLYLYKTSQNGRTELTSSDTEYQKMLEVLKDSVSTYDVNNGSATKASTVTPQPSGDGGYFVIQKSYVKYTFDVLPGKTYFLFSNYSKLGLCGFKFDAETSASATDITLDNQVTNYTPTTNELANVTLAGRKFTAGQWTTLCLPFSVSATQMKSVFGENVQLIEMAQTVLAGNKYNGEKYSRNTIVYTNHVYNQMLVAGVPYLLKPSKSIDAGKAVFNNVYFPKTSVNAGTVDCGNSYKWTGVYNNTTLNANDYYVSGKDGTLKYYTTGGHNSNSFRAFLHYTGAAAKAVVFEAMSVGAADAEDNNGTTTGIETIKVADLDPTVFNTGKIYNLNGQVVSNNSTQLSSLPAGIYIVNGKKVVNR
jgi:hypothetical protein